MGGMNRWDMAPGTQKEEEKEPGAAFPVKRGVLMRLILFIASQFLSVCRLDIILMCIDSLLHCIESRFSILLDQPAAEIDGLPSPSVRPDCNFFPDQTDTNEQNVKNTVEHKAAEI